MCLYYLYMSKYLALLHIYNINDWVMSIDIWKLPILDFATLFWFNIIFGITLMQLLILGLMMNRLSCGQSGLEHSKNDKDYTYDLGYDLNWEMAFGKFKRKFYPSRTSHTINLTYLKFLSNSILTLINTEYSFKNPLLNTIASFYNKLGWLFFFLDDNSRNLEDDMRRYYGFECTSSNPV